jgi:pilus assembly protein TadC
MERTELIAHLAVALATGMFGFFAAWALTDLFGGSPPAERNEWESERRRRERIRGDVVWYRLAEGAVDDLAASGWMSRLTGDALLARELRFVDVDPIPWTIGEFRALTIAWAAGAWLLITLLFTLAGEPFIGLLLGWLPGLLILLLPPMMVKSVAARRREAILTRLPFSMDLIAIIFRQQGLMRALETIASDESPHPLREEFRLLLRQKSDGVSDKEVFVRFRNRIDHPDIDQMVAAIEQAMKFNQPLTDVFGAQADLMLQRRFQRVEGQSHRAQVYLVFPSVLTLVACLIVVIVPFISMVLGQSAKTEF